MKDLLAYLTNLAALWLASAWILMIGIGVVHAEWLPGVPTIGFSTALLFSTLFTGRSIINATFVLITKAIGGDS